MTNIPYQYTCKLLHTVNRELGLNKALWPFWRVRRDTKNGVHLIYIATSPSDQLFVAEQKLQFRNVTPPNTRLGSATFMRHWNIFQMYPKILLICLYWKTWWYLFELFYHLIWERSRVKLKRIKGISKALETNEIYIHMHCFCCFIDLQELWRRKPSHNDVFICQF